MAPVRVGIYSPGNPDADPPEPPEVEIFEPDSLGTMSPTGERFAVKALVAIPAGARFVVAVVPTESGAEWAVALVDC